MRKAYIWTRSGSYATEVNVRDGVDYDVEVRAAMRSCIEVADEVPMICTCGPNDDQDAAIASFKAMRERVVERDARAAKG